MRYKLIIFDSDGTLADTLPWMRSVFNELADEYGFRRVEAHEYEQFRDLHGAELLKAVNLPLWKVPQVMTAMRGRMAARIDEFRLYPGISEALRELGACGIQLGVVSSNSTENVRRILGPDAPLIRYFSCGASLFGKPRHLRTVLKKSGIHPEATLYVGDEVRDAQAARQVGISFAAVTWGQQSENRLQSEKPDFLLRSIQELGKISDLQPGRGATPASGTHG